MNEGQLSGGITFHDVLQWRGVLNRGIFGFVFSGELFVGEGLGDVEILLIDVFSDFRMDAIEPIHICFSDQFL